MTTLFEDIIIVESCITGFKKIPDNSIQCCVTSVPYYGLRDYGHSDQIGLENTPELYIKKLVKVFKEVRRVLKSDGTLWLNIGDSYAGSGKGVGDNYTGRWKQDTNKGSKTITKRNRNISGSIKPKDLIGIPWLLAFALRKIGWYLRQDIIWSKPNPMPESVLDRCTKSHEYIFLFSKSLKYFFDSDSIKTNVTDSTIQRMLQQIDNQKGSDWVPGKTNVPMKAVRPGRNIRKGIDKNGGNQGNINGIPAMAINGNGVNGHSGYFDNKGNLIGGGKANKKSVWTVSTKPFKEAHFAVFPEELIVDCIKAGCPLGGVVLDPFIGSGTTAVVSKKLGRKYLGFEVNEFYVKLAKKRIHNEIGLFQ